MVKRALCLFLFREKTLFHIKILIGICEKYGKTLFYLKNTYIGICEMYGNMKTIVLDVRFGG